MTVTKANWHTTTPPPEIPGANPFEAPVEEIGQRIDLADPAGLLFARLKELIHREGRLYNLGTECEIKHLPDTTCLACPLSQAGDKHSPMGTLCRIGREQSVVLTEMAVAEHAKKKK